MHFGWRKYYILALAGALTLAGCTGASELVPSRTSTPLSVMPTVASLNTPTLEPSPALAVTLPSPTSVPTVAATPTARPRRAAFATPRAVPNVAFASPVNDAPSTALTSLIERFVQTKEGRYGVAVKNLKTGEIALYKATEQFEAASLYKLNLMYGAFELAGKGELSLDDQMTVTEMAATGYGDGDATLEVGETVSVREAVERAITVSDNTCAHALLEKLPVWKINDSFKKLGLKQTEINAGTRTSPQDMLRLMEMIADGKALSTDASRQMLTLLLRQEINDRLPLYLPEGVPVAHKTGNLTGLRHDAGIVYGPSGPYVIAVLVDGLKDELPGDNTATDDIADLSRAVYDYFNPAKPQG